MKEIVSIKWANLSANQVLYVDSVIMPKIETILTEHSIALDALGEPCFRPLCSHDCKNCTFEEICIESIGD